MEKPPGRARSHLPLAKQAWTSSIVMTHLASQPAKARNMHNFHNSCSVDDAVVERALIPLWEVQDRYLQSPSILEAPNGCLFAGIAQHTRPMPPMLHYPARSACEEGSAASTEASKAHGCGHVWIQTVFVLIIFLGFSLHATQVCHKTRKFGAVSIQFADDEQHSQCRELSDCHKRLQWPGSHSRTLHEAFHPPCGFALPLARSLSSN